MNKNLQISIFGMRRSKLETRNSDVHRPPCITLPLSSPDDDSAGEGGGDELHHKSGLGHRQLGPPHLHLVPLRVRGPGGVEGRGVAGEGGHLVTRV